MGNGIAMWIAFCFLVSWIPMQWKLRIVGYGFVTDVTVHVVLQTLFGGDAGGRVAMLFAGILINLTMHAFRWGFGYEKLTVKGWVRFAGRWTKLSPPKPTKRTRTRRSEHAASKQYR